MLLPKLGGSWLLPPRDFPHQLRVTLWITTAIHLDTPSLTTDPSLTKTSLSDTLRPKRPSEGSFALSTNCLGFEAGLDRRNEVSLRGLF